ncbi:hypothetical protein C7M84_001955 [Penaeus vannamei]|uniref:Uncharacterized protein n=1 Tax=Penaeus vannamei TaxID=6689 RepID=A0A3R7ME14_PENVA|nr:hypothetical protein C7M84_001955 [Penaeus vannamei]
MTVYAAPLFTGPSHYFHYFLNVHRPIDPFLPAAEPPSQSLPRGSSTSRPALLAYFHTGDDGDDATPRPRITAATLLNSSLQLLNSSLQLLTPHSAPPHSSSTPHSSSSLSSSSSTPHSSSSTPHSSFYALIPCSIPLFFMLSPYPSLSPYSLLPHAPFPLSSSALCHLRKDCDPSRSRSDVERCECMMLSGIFSSPIGLGIQTMYNFATSRQDTSRIDKRHLPLSLAPPLPSSLPPPLPSLSHPPHFPLLFPTPSLPSLTPTEGTTAAAAATVGADGGGGGVEGLPKRRRNCVNTSLSIHPALLSPPLATTDATSQVAPRDEDENCRLCSHTALSPLNGRVIWSGLSLSPSPTIRRGAYGNSPVASHSRYRCRVARLTTPHWCCESVGGGCCISLSLPTRHSP